MLAGRTAAQRRYVAEGPSTAGQGRLAADQANAQRRRACLALFDESALSLTPNVRRTCPSRVPAPAGHRARRLDPHAALAHGSGAGRWAAGRCLRGLAAMVPPRLQAVSGPPPVRPARAAVAWPLPPRPDPVAVSFEADQAGQVLPTRASWCCQSWPSTAPKSRWARWSWEGVPMVAARRLPGMLRSLPAVLGPSGSATWPTRGGSASTLPAAPQRLQGPLAATRLRWRSERSGPNVPACTGASGVQPAPGPAVGSQAGQPPAVSPGPGGGRSRPPRPGRSPPAWPGCWRRARRRSWG